MSATATLQQRLAYFGALAAVASMGNASSEIQSSVEEITDENWSKQLEKYLEIENADVQADLIYLFDGKAVSGELPFTLEAGINQ